jgi:predicted adenine nucleotide alpha hydrolase (AANH) superfamily ATPase
MIIEARKIIKKKVREELKDYLERIRVTSEDEERARKGLEELNIRLEEKAKEAADAKDSEAKEGEAKVPEEGIEDKN